MGTTVNSLLQTYLNGVSGSVVGGTAGFSNFNDVNGNSGAISGTGTNYLEEVTHTTNDGSSTAGAPLALPVIVNPLATTLVDQVPGNLTVSGSSVTSSALFGASSNVTYSVNGGAGSIYAAGGSNSIYAQDATETVFSAGNDTLTFASSHSLNENVSAVGNATTRVYVGGSDVATVTASIRAQASVVFLTNAGGNLDFINASNKSQTIYSGSYTTAGGGNVYATNAVTAFGGSGGGFFVGGRGGFNDLNGGTGDSTLIGGGASDTLMAGGASNFLFTGQGAETLIGGGGANNFYVGLEDVGIGTVRAVGDLVSAGGSGSQSFVLGELASTTLTGSTVSGASNVYDLLGTFTTTGGQAATFGGGDFTVTDFGAHDTIFLLNGSYGTGSGAASVETVSTALGGGGSQILLTDGTVITLKGISTSKINVGLGGHEITLK